MSKELRPLSGFCNPTHPDCPHLAKIKELEEDAKDKTWDLKEWPYQVHLRAKTEGKLIEKIRCLYDHALQLTETKARIKELEGALRRYGHHDPKHSIGTAVDEDGCCVSCGEDLNHIACQALALPKCKTCGDSGKVPEYITKDGMIDRRPSSEY